MTDGFGGRVAIVTGAAGGIGSVILRRLAEAGAGVVIADVDAERATATASDVASRGGDVLFVRTDVRDGPQVDAMVDRTVERFGRVDVLVHGAGGASTRRSSSCPTRSGTCRSTSSSAGPSSWLARSAGA